ncbi:hypothetical protein K1T35_47750 (plasmid) [Pseudonocardia sp. DSM 110487]|uniref:hypothetical protein n=1 Tax=Pseudonocardia sp. DSM 110487 TaxID=2865833 RepID=UPI001C6A6D68|nr:hypothetical protein [Pseudonocardia sp. DSM 110487]QYN41046.1 hypothetical protein K1T35_47750 [Pseudonocardia sp. DSM 110487]
MPYDPNRSEDDNYENPTPDRWDPYADADQRAEEHFQDRIRSEVRQKGAFPRR